MSDFISLNQHQKKALVIQLYEQGKTRRQIAEVAHMGFKDIADVINEYTGEDITVNKPVKSKDARAFELFLQGKQSVEVAIELDMPADKVEELHVQYWRLSKLDNLEILYHEAEYSLSLLLRLHNILKDRRITKNEDIYDLIELANTGLSNIRNRHEELSYQIMALENQKTALGTENLGLKNSIYANNEIIRKQNVQLRSYGIINTIHLQQKRWYKTRKPRLQLEILASLVLHGKLSKGMTRSFLKHGTYSEIIKAFNRLEINGLINKLSECKFSRGRRQYYYKITQKGLALLITDDPHPLKFWKILFGYCHHDGKGLTLDKINEFYNLFMERYLKYRNTGFSFQLDIFDNTREQWLREIINNSDEIRLDQKVIEVLAIYPRITFEELVKKAGATENEVKKCLSTYTLESYSPLDDKTAYIHQNVTGKKHNKKYWDFLLHNTIISRQSNSTKVYELSLFGVILALTVIRCKDQDKFRHHLYYQDLSFVEYYGNIAHNYKKKLPLIFGKWNLLTDVLGLFSAYIFDIILDKEMRLSDSDKLSVIRGGNKELSDGAREIVYQTRQQIGALADMGMAVWLNYSLSLPYEYEGQGKIPKMDYLLANDVDVQPHPDLERIYGLKKKLDEIIWILNPLESDLSEVVKERFSDELEKQLENEITALYYFQLYFDYEFNARIGEPKGGHYYSSNSADVPPKSLWPKECLSVLIKKDVDEPLLSEWFYNLIEEINSLQKEIYNALPKRTI